MTESNWQHALRIEVKAGRIYDLLQTASQEITELQQLLEADTSDSKLHRAPEVAELRIVLRRAVIKDVLAIKNDWWGIYLARKG